MIITQGFEAVIIGAHNRNVLIIDGLQGPLEITASITGIDKFYRHSIKPFEGRVKFPVQGVSRQIYRKLLNYVDPFDYSADVVYANSAAYHFAAMMVVLYDGFSQVNMSARIINGALQIGDGVFDDYVGSVLTFLPCTAYVAPINQDPVAFNDTFCIEQGNVLTGNVLAANPVNSDYDYDGDTLSVTTFVVGSTSYTIGVDNFVATYGTIRIESSGALTYTPSPSFVGDFILNYTITDGNGGSDNAQVIITVKQVGLFADNFADNYE